MAGIENGTWSYIRWWYCYFVTEIRLKWWVVTYRKEHYSLPGCINMSSPVIMWSPIISSTPLRPCVHSVHTCSYATPKNCCIFYHHHYSLTRSLGPHIFFMMQYFAVTRCLATSAAKQRSINFYSNCCQIPQPNNTINGKLLITY